MMPTNDELKLYCNDILARRMMINAAFRVLDAKDKEKHQKKMVKKYGNIIIDAVRVAALAEGNCRAAMEDDADLRLSDRWGWDTIQQMKAESIERNRLEFELLRQGVY